MQDHTIDYKIVYFRDEGFKIRTHFQYPETIQNANIFLIIWKKFSR